MKSLVVFAVIWLYEALTMQQTTVNYGKFIEGGRLYMNMSSMVGSPVVQTSFAWNTSKVEPISFFDPVAYVERTIPIVSLPNTLSAEVVYADIGAANNLRILHRVKSSVSGPDRLASMPEAAIGTSSSVDLVAPDGWVNNCTIENKRAQVYPYAVYCYNTSDPIEVNVTTIPKVNRISCACWKQRYSGDQLQGSNTSCLSGTSGFYCVNTTIVEDGTPVTNSTNVTTWKFVQYLARFTPNDFNFSSRSNESHAIPVYSQKVPTDCVPDVVPQESENLDFFYKSCIAGGPMELIFLWPKPRVLSATPLTEMTNNTQIYMIRTLSNESNISVDVLTPAFNGDSSGLCVFTYMMDVRAYYNTNNNNTRFIIVGVSNYTANTASGLAIWDCSLNIAALQFDSCRIINSTAYDLNFPLTNIVHKSNGVIDVIFTSRSDLLKVTGATYTFGTSTSITAQTPVPTSTYPMHATKNAFFTDFSTQYGDAITNGNWSYTFNTYMANKSFYAFSTNEQYVNYKVGYLFSFGGVYRMFTNVQHKNNFVIDSNLASGLESYLFQHNTTALTNTTFNLSYENVPPPFSSNAIASNVDNTARVKCYKAKYCRQVSNVAPVLANKWAPTYYITGHPKDGTNGALIAIEQMPMAYVNTGPEPGLVTNNYFVLPDIAFYVSAYTFDTDYLTKSCYRHREVFMSSHICSNTIWPKVWSPATTIPPTTRFYTGSIITIYHSNRRTFIEGVRIVPANNILSYIIQQRSPNVNHNWYNYTGCNNDPTFSTVIDSTSALSLLSCYNNITNTSHIVGLSIADSYFISNAYQGMIVPVYITTIPERIMKLTVTKENSIYYASMVYNVSRHGFTIQRYPLTVTTTTVNPGSAIFSLQHNEWQYNNGTPAKDYHFCASNTSILLIINKQRLFVNNWDFGTVKNPYLHHHTWMNGYNILYSQCYSDNVGAPLLLLLANFGTSTNFLIFNTANVTDVNNLLILNQTLPESIPDTATPESPIIALSRTSFFVKLTKKVYSFRLDPTDYTFQATDSATTPNTEQILYNMKSFSFTGANSVKSQTLSYTTVAEFTTLDISNPTYTLFNLTNNLTNSTNPNITRVYIDTVYNYVGHIWELKLVKPPYVLKNVELNTRIRKADMLRNTMLMEALDANFASPQSLTHTKFAFLGNTTLIIQNLAGEATYLEAKPAKVMTQDTQIKWNATINRNCYEVSLLSQNFPSFTAVLKCRYNNVGSENKYYIYGIQGTMALPQATYPYNHFIADYPSTSDDSGSMEAITGTTADHFVMLLHFPNTNSAIMYAINFSPFVASTTTITAFGTIKATSSPITNVNYCSLMRCKPSRNCFLSVCTGVQPSSTKFVKMSSTYVVDATATPYQLDFVPHSQYCNINELAVKNLIKCIYSNPSELVSIDFDEENTFALGTALAGSTNPRRYVLLQDWMPTTLTFSRNFIGYIGKQLTYNINEPISTTSPITPTPANFAFVVYHITSDGLLNYTTQIGQNYSYAAYILPKGSSQSTPFHESKIFPWTEPFTWIETLNETNKTYTTIDNYFFFQEASGDIYSHKIDPYILTVLNNHTKIKTFLDETSFSSDQNNMVSTIATSTLFENLRAAQKTTVAVAAAADTGVSKTAATSMILIGCLAAAVILIAVLYFLFRKKEAGTVDLSKEMRHESGVLRL